MTENLSQDCESIGLIYLLTDLYLNMFAFQRMSL